jgi:RNA polymerase sigma factor (sigma-70 family)
MLAADNPEQHNVTTLYADHHSWLQGWLRRRLGNAADAADLAQDVFVGLLVKPQVFDSVSNVRAYLSTVGNGMCVSLWRRRQIEQAWIDELAARPESVAPSEESRAIIIDALCEIDAMLGKLSQKAASAFVMAMVYEMPDKQIAEKLGVSDRMVRKYVAQAMFQCMKLDLSHG